MLFCGSIIKRCASSFVVVAHYNPHRNRKTDGRGEGRRGGGGGGADGRDQPVESDQTIRILDRLVSLLSLSREFPLLSDVCVAAAYVT